MEEKQWKRKKETKKEFEVLIFRLTSSKFLIGCKKASSKEEYKFDERDELKERKASDETILLKNI